jgi:excisionase family DNA binding protein
MDNASHAHPDWLDARLFEQEYPFKQRTFWKLIAEGKLPAYRPSKRKTLVRRSDVERLLEASKAGVSLDKIVDDVMSELGAGR